MVVYVVHVSLVFHVVLFLVFLYFLSGYLPGFCLGDVFVFLVLVWLHLWRLLSGCCFHECVVALGVACKHTTCCCVDVPGVWLLS